MPVEVSAGNLLICTINQTNLKTIKMYFEDICGIQGIGDEYLI